MVFTNKEGQNSKLSEALKQAQKTEIEIESLKAYQITMENHNRSYIKRIKEELKKKDLIIERLKN